MTSEPVLREWRKTANAAWLEAVKANMTETECTFRRAWREYRTARPWDNTDTDDLERPLYVTTCPGAYQHSACVVVTIEGSPPRALLLVTTDLGPSEARVYVMGLGERVRVIHNRRPENGQALRSAILALLVERGAVPEWWKPSKYEDDRKPDSLDFYMGAANAQ